jgi:uncharacterized RDD family membrane protein YckC
MLSNIIIDMHCLGCGIDIKEELGLCLSCRLKRERRNSKAMILGQMGEEVKNPEGNESQDQTNDQVDNTLKKEFDLSQATPAHSGYRIAAFVIDGWIVGAIYGLIILIYVSFLNHSPTEWLKTASKGEAVAILVGSFMPIIIVSLSVSPFYFVFFNSSRLQATPGKLLLGMRLVNLKGGDLGVGRAILRFFGANLYIALIIPGLFLLMANFIFLGIIVMISAVILSFGNYLWIFSNHERKAIHDLIAQTRVVAIAEPSLKVAIISLIGTFLVSSLPNLLLRMLGKTLPQ